ncbi:MAG: hypothetical protein NZU63_07815 [Gemmataceae bacterium]|nr:hypothetical protein [Gemmataceae bacterium]MDW8242146.1 hypothetical protein [Thermogemmata sp.]
MVRSGWLAVLIISGISLAAPARLSIPVVWSQEPAGPGLKSAPSPASSPREDDTDPLPVRRLRVMPAQLPEVIKQLELGPLRRVGRQEFEQQLRQARRLLAETRQSPLLSELRLTAVLEGNDLIGQAECDIVHTGSEPRLLVLEPWRAALGAATWSDGRGAVVGLPAGSNQLAVWVERSGNQTLRCDWSAAGTFALNERRFDLRWPLASTAWMTLDLPTGLFPAVSGEVLVTGPHPVANPQLRRWRIRFSGRSRLDLIIRPVVNPPSVTVTEVRSRLDLQAGGWQCAYEFDLHPVHGNGGTWTFQLDPQLLVTDVISTPRANWSIDGSPSDKSGRLLQVTLPPTSIPGRLLIQALAPPPAAAAVQLPWLRLQNGIVLREAIEVRLSPDWKIQHWAVGDYRLIQAAVTADGTQVLSLQGHWLAPGNNRPYRRLPQLTLLPVEASVGIVREQLVWDVETVPPRLTIRLQLQVQRGPLFQFRCRLPAGYELLRFTASSDAWLAAWDKKGNQVTVEWGRPLPTGQTAELLWELRAVQPLATASPVVPFPVFTPYNVRERNGMFVIMAGHSRSGRIVTGPGTESLGWFDWDFAVPPAHATAVFRYRGTDVSGYWQPEPINAADGKPFSAEVLSRPAQSPATPAPQTPQEPRLRNPFVYVLLTDATERREAIFWAGVTLELDPSPSGGPIPAILPITLSDGVRIDAVQIDGRWLDPSAVRPGEQNEWFLPLPARVSPDGIPVLLCGRLPLRQRGLWLQLQPPAVRWAGQDVTGPCYCRFGAGMMPVFAGLRPAPDSPWPSAVMPTALSEDGGSDWLVTTPEASIYVGHVQTARLAGWGLLAFFLTLLYWSRGHHRQFWGVVSSAGLGLVAALVSPAWWQQLLLLGSVPTLGVAAVLRLVPLMATWRTAIILVAVACPLLEYTPWLHAQGASPAESTVLLLPPDAQGREEVLVPLSLWDRLTALRPVLPSWILTESHYEVTLSEATAQVDARWVVHVLEGTEPTFLLPLGDARLEAVRIHDVAAYPSVVRPGLYAIPLPGKGRQEIHARFVVAISGNADRELRWGIPECPRTTLVVLAQSPLHQLFIPSRLGRLQIAQAKHPWRMQAEVGSVRQIILRWRQTGDGVATLRVREGCLWDLHPQGIELTAAYWLDVVAGSITQLEIQIPEELEVTSLTVRSPDSGESGVVRSWSLEPPRSGGRPLRIDWRIPLSGRWLLVLQAVPRSPASRHPILRFPRVVSPAAGESDTFYVLRLRETALEGLQRQGVIDFSSDLFLQFFGSVPELRLDPAQALRVFRPVAGTLAELRPLMQTLQRPDYELDTRWQIGVVATAPTVPPTAGNTQATVVAWAMGTIRWKDAATPGYLEFALPNVTVTEIRGPEVAHWSYRAGVLQIWLRRPLSEGTLQWYGQATPPLSTAWELPLPRPADAAPGHERWYLQVRSDTLPLTVHYERLNGWALQTASSGAAREFMASSQRPAPPLPRLLLQPLPSSPSSAQQR